MVEPNRLRSASRPNVIVGTHATGDEASPSGVASIDQRADQRRVPEAASDATPGKAMTLGDRVVGYVIAIVFYGIVLVIGAILLAIPVIWLYFFYLKNPLVPVALVVLLVIVSVSFAYSYTISGGIGGPDVAPASLRGRVLDKILAVTCILALLALIAVFVGATLEILIWGY